MWQNAIEIYMSHSKMAFDCNLSKSAVKRALKFLEKERFITIVSGRNEYKTNIYIINFEQIDNACIKATERDRMVS
jgi:DNA-binding transcriptional regulator YhcF (GntR family)